MLRGKPEFSESGISVSFVETSKHQNREKMDTIYLGVHRFLEWKYWAIGSCALSTARSNSNTKTESSSFEFRNPVSWSRNNWHIFPPPSTPGPSIIAQAFWQIGFVFLRETSVEEQPGIFTYRPIRVVLWRAGMINLFTALCDFHFHEVYDRCGERMHLIRGQKFSLFSSQPWRIHLAPRKAGWLFVTTSSGSTNWPNGKVFPQSQEEKSTLLLAVPYGRTTFSCFSEFRNEFPSS